MNLIPSLLFPWFLAGSLAVALPIALHFLRRSPRGRTIFSSLMFVPTSPPTLTRRSRLDDWLLLLLRAAVLLLLAFAFARPFFQSADSREQVNVRGRRAAILIDTSASMRRGNLWQQAIGELDRAVSRLSSEADLAVYTFDDTVKTLVPFADAADPQVAPVNLAQLKQQLAASGPSWGATDLSSALSALADTLLAWQERQRNQAALQIILISDLQEGSQQERLQAYEWPPHIQVDVRAVRLPELTNAGLQLLATNGELETDGNQRVRVVNQSDSTGEQFALRWWAADEPLGEPLPVYVPPGESRVVRLPQPPPAMRVDQLVLTGDDCAFDNRRFVIPTEQQDVTVVYSGLGALDDPAQMPYFLNLTMIDSDRRRLRLHYHPVAGDEAFPIDAATGLIVLCRSLSPNQVQQLHAYADGGGTLLFVVPDASVAATLGALLEDPSLRLEESSGDYVMLGQIDFEHPLFSRFSGARYNDFTKIRFARHRRILAAATGNADVIARFDNGDPAVLAQRRGQGRIVILASGWQPVDSQFALSTKFVPFIEGLLEDPQSAAEGAVDWRVHDAVPLKGFATVETPGGEQITMAPQATHFEDTDTPGIYRAQNGAQTRAWSVNLAASEARTTPLDSSALEQYGVHLGATPTREVELQRSRRLRRRELEGSQKLWRWTIIAALGLLMLETWAASRPKPDNPPLASTG